MQRNSSPSELCSSFALKTNARSLVDANLEIWSLINESKSSTKMMAMANESFNAQVCVPVFKLLFSKKYPCHDMKDQ